jgi:hypothetical protein
MFSNTRPSISVLCVCKNSNYELFPYLDLWNAERNVYLFNSGNPVIAHPPCAQWGKLKYFAKENQLEKKLAIWCFELVLMNGGIFEHPEGSTIFKYMGYKPTMSVNLNWFGSPFKKTTYLFFNRFKPAAFPLNFDAITQKVQDVSCKNDRNKTPVKMIEFFLRSINQ